MFITRMALPRRTFLRGMGVTLALPLLESMVPALTPLRLTAAAPVRRFVGIWHPHGAAPGYWSPLKEGRDFDFSFITKPLEPFRDRVVLVTGLDMPEAMATDEEPPGPLDLSSSILATDFAYDAPSVSVDTTVGLNGNGWRGLAIAPHATDHAALAFAPLLAAVHNPPV